MRMNKTTMQKEEEAAKAEAEIAFHEQIFERIRAIVAQELNCQEDDVRLDSQFCADLGADDLHLVEICMAVEENFDIDEIPDSIAEEIVGEVSSVAMLCDYVAQHITPDYLRKRIEKRSRAKAVSPSKVRRLCKLIQNGEAIPAGLLPDAPTMAAWILYCKRNGLFAEGVILYEQGDIDTDKLSDDCAVRLEEDYRICKRRVEG